MIFTARRVSNLKMSCVATKKTRVNQHYHKPQPCTDQSPPSHCECMRVSLMSTNQRKPVSRRKSLRGMDLESPKSSIKHQTSNTKDEVVLVLHNGCWRAGTVRGNGAFGARCLAENLPSLVVLCRNGRNARSSLSWSSSPTFKIAISSVVAQ